MALQTKILRTRAKGNVNRALCIKRSLILNKWKNEQLALHFRSTNNYIPKIKNFT